MLHLRFNGKNQRFGIGLRQWAIWVHSSSLTAMAAGAEKRAENLGLGEAESLGKGTLEVISKSFKLYFLVGFFFSALKNI